MKLYRDFLKRAIDLCVALVVFILAFPFFLLGIILLWIVNKGTPFFFQPRPGKNGKIFKVIKFKTMNDRRDLTGELLPDTERLSNVGKLVRKTSLDEVPQLINVIKGEMSLIGPRPLLVEYLPLYTSLQNRRHEVKPGITGWAQVNGRNAIDWEEKFKYDVWYVDNVSFILDIKILLMTVMKVFKSEGISANGHVTIEKFKGSGK
jgi:undecaprenyl phosphate N,N'-diacetylbacillosamine 1-phosphate transferase